MVILFMNKCDLLDRKLKADIKLNAHLVTYGDRSNSSGTAVKCVCFILGLCLHSFHKHKFLHNVSTMY